MNARSSSRAALALFALLAPFTLLAGSLAPGLVREARADALPPPTPLSCPAGSTVAHDHGGTHCVKNAPANCPAGWRGVSGGTCALALCAPGAACGAGKACKSVALCSRDEITYAESDAPVRGAQLAAPPAPRMTRLFLEPCGPSSACPGKARCRGAHVCLPTDAAAPAARPKNASPAYSYDLSKDDPPPTDYAQPPPAASTSDPPPTNYAQPPPAASTSVEPVAVTDARPPGKSGGCAGCTVAPARSSGGPLFAALATALACVTVLGRRRR